MNERVRSIGGIHRWNNTDSSELKYFDKTLFQCYWVDHKSHGLA